MAAAAGGGAARSLVVVQAEFRVHDVVDAPGVSDAGGWLAAGVVGGGSKLVASWLPANIGGGLASVEGSR